MALRGPVNQSSLHERRLKAVRLFEQGITPSEVARRLGVHRQSAGRWRKEWLAGGNEALESKGSLGRRSSLRPDQMEALAAILRAGPGAAGMESEAWTLSLVVRVIHREFGVRHHPGHVSRLLAAKGLSPAARARNEAKRSGTVTAPRHR